jgi:FAD-linked oxidoreductase
MLPVKNWAKNLSFHPQEIHSPQNETELVNILKNNPQRKVRVRGSSHSWTGGIVSNDIFIHLDKTQGLISFDKAASTATAYAGTKLSLLCEEIFKHDLAMINQGDINKQSLAGALSTGTHGTGVKLQSISNQVLSSKLVTAEGEVLEINSGDLKDALGVSFGSLGILSEVKLQLRPVYRLKLESFAESMHEALVKVDQRRENNRHFEMFYFPVGDWSLIKIMNETDEDVTISGLSDRINDVVIENWLYELLNRLAASTKSYKKIDLLMRKFISPQQRVHWSHRLFPTDRNVRFMEMEYNLPIEKFEVVFDEMKWVINKRKFQTLLPIEIRFVKGDSLWLSPAYGRDSVYFAVHTYVKEDYRPYFSAMEEIFKRHKGRPHWGKMHTLKAADFQEIYPRWEQFCEMRKKLDPQGIFINNHLQELFGL